MATAQPLVSLLVATYDNVPYRTETLKETVASLLAQTYPNIEILVGLDGAGAGHEAAARSFKDPRLRVIAFERNRGNGAVWNDLFDQSGGRYILFSADDDLLLPEFTAKMVAALAGGAGYAYSHFYSWWPEDGRKEVNEHCWTANLHALLVSREALERFRLKEGHIFPLMRSCADMVMITLLRRGEEGAHVHEPLVLYRRHTAQLSIEYGLRQLLDLAHARNVIGKPIPPRELLSGFAWRMTQRTGITRDRILGRSRPAGPR